MLENCESAREHRGVTPSLHGWLHERQDMLVRYCALSGADMASDDASKFVSESVRELCEVMMDYVSAGHFKVYDELLQDGQRRRDQQALTRANRFYAIVEQTTDTVLDFNDKYQELDDLSSLLQDLSQLGEQLATRFEAEDSMITLMQKH